ncbi:MAG: tetratricopeptide repeat protein [Acidobacteria bacterium]|nr:MAG: tetratricopeptide repeat protein [Acidobacteriota bacterium]REK11329.1 MAG: tetratricopeptide repeat protein [Acidobacteriota bacterium]
MIPNQRRPRVGITLALALFGVLFAFSSSPAAAQDTLEVEVVDQKGKKVAEAQIVATPSEGGEPVTGTANKKGKYTAALAPGAWDLVVTAPGFGATKAAVQIEAGMTYSGTITMVDAETARLQEARDAFNAGVARIQENDDEGALEQFEKAASIDDSLSEAHRLIALITSQSGDIDRAEAALERYFELQPDGMQQIAPAAYEVYRARGDAERLPAARQAVRDIGAARDLASKVFNEGVAKNREDDKQGAIALFEEAAALDPTLAAAFRSIAALHFNDQEYEQALAALDSLLGLDPEHKEGLRMAFFSHYELGDPEKATEYGRRWVAQAPGATNEVVDTAKRTFEGNNPEDARKLLEVALAFDPDHAVGHYTLGRVYAGLGDIPAAKKHLNRFLELSPNHPEAGDARSMLEGL